jgi:nitrous oxide reductase accessory protein NosL
MKQFSYKLLAEKMKKIAALYVDSATIWSKWQIPVYSKILGIQGV